MRTVAKRRPTSTQTCRLDMPSWDAVASAASRAATRCTASSLITSARRAARSHASAGAVSTPRSATTGSSAIPESPPPPCT